MALAVIAAMLAAAGVGRRRSPPRARLVTLAGPSPHRPVSSPDAAVDSAPRGRRLLGASIALMAGRLVVGGGFGWAVGLAAAGGVALIRWRRPGSTVDPDELAVVVDLMAGCLAAGTSLAAALDAASAAAQRPLRLRCQAQAAALRAGVPADEAWRPWLVDPWLAPVARTAVRTAATGAAAAADLRRTAARLRARRRAAAQHKVRRASVWIVAPLGLCFLPAFVLVAVVPLVIGLVPALH